jgi:hypothetical protein
MVQGSILGTKKSREREQRSTDHGKMCLSLRLIGRLELACLSDGFGEVRSTWSNLQRSLDFSYPNFILYHNNVKASATSQLLITPVVLYFWHMHS